MRRCRGSNGVEGVINCLVEHTCMAYAACCACNYMVMFGGHLDLTALTLLLTRMDQSFSSMSSRYEFTQDLLGRIKGIA